jgi:hypothetical protein
MARPLPRFLTACAALALCGLAIAATPAAAQTAALERERAAVFAQMLDAPTDRALMRRYAQLSIELRDFEAAAATLERIVDLEPGNAAARVELAIAYFALGAYDVAEYHLDAAAQAGGLDPATAATLARYREEAARRDSPHQISGRVAVGQAWTRTADETGRFGTAELEWRFDMGGPNADDWLTQLSHQSYMPGELSFSDRAITRLRTGPEFRLTGDAYGPRLQPYVEMTWFRDDSFGFGDYNAVALGLAYQNPHTPFLTSYADIQAGRAEAQVPFGTAFDFREASVGLGWRPSRETRLRGSLRWREEVSDDFFFPVTLTTRTIRIEALHAFDPGLQMLPRRWELRGWAQRQDYEEDFGFGFVDGYVDTVWGAGLRAFVTDALFLEARASRLEREFDFAFIPVERETVYALQVGWEF